MLGFTGDNNCVPRRWFNNSVRLTVPEYQYHHPMGLLDYFLPDRLTAVSVQLHIMLREKCLKRAKYCHQAMIMLREHVHATHQQYYLPARQSPWWEAPLIDEPERRRRLYQFREIIWYECVDVFFSIITCIQKHTSFSYDLHAMTA